MEQFLNSISLEALIALSGIFVALLLPISLFLLESIGGENSRTLNWDSRVILSKVLNVEELFFYILLVSVPLIFWDIQKLVSLLLIILGYMGLIITLFNAYQWIISRSKDYFSWHKPKSDMTYRNIKRLEYLNSLNTESEILEVWATIFQTKGWIGVDKQKLMEAYVEALGKIAKIAEGKAEIRKFTHFQYEEELMSYLIHSLDGKYDDSNFSFDTIGTFVPLQEYIFTRYFETFDDMYRNKNVRFLLNYFLEYRNQNTVYGYTRISDSALDFNQHFIKLVTDLVHLDKSSPRANKISRVEELLSYFGFTYLDNIDYKALSFLDNYYFPETWKIMSNTIKEYEGESVHEILMNGWLKLFIDYIVKHRKNENSRLNGKNKYPVSMESNDRLVHIINHFFPHTNATSLIETLELYLFLRTRTKPPTKDEWEIYIKKPQHILWESKKADNENKAIAFNKEAIKIIEDYYESSFHAIQNVIPESIEAINSINCNNDIKFNVQSHKKHILEILKLLNESPTN